MEKKDLLNKYAIDYAKQEHPFLLFNLAGGDENAHTRILHSGDTKAFLKGRISVLNLIIERNQTIQNIPGITYSRNTAKKKLSVKIKAFDPNNPSERANTLNEIIAQLQDEIKIVDKFIFSLAKNPISAPNDKLVKLLS